MFFEVFFFFIAVNKIQNTLLQFIVLRIQTKPNYNEYFLITYEFEANRTTEIPITEIPTFRSCVHEAYRSKI